MRVKRTFPCTIQYTSRNGGPFRDSRGNISVYACVIVSMGGPFRDRPGGPFRMDPYIEITSREHQLNARKEDVPMH